MLSPQFPSLSLKGNSCYVLEATIHKCFDKIDHEKLLKKIDTFDQMENQIKSWLKANIMVALKKNLR